jgi:hypothetical protein
MLVPIELECPHCGELFNSSADTSEGDYTTIEDCQVCCRPMEVVIECEEGQVNSCRTTAM